MSTPHALYRFYDTKGQLLYIGITINPGNRWAAHRDTKPWWTQVTSITLEEHPDRASVLEAERLAIVIERPRYNVMHNRAGRPSHDRDSHGSMECITTWMAEDMPDGCHDHCEDGAIYLPYLWADGCGRYQCRNRHEWRCWWGHHSDGFAPELRGVPIWTAA